MQWEAHILLSKFAEDDTLERARSSNPSQLASCEATGNSRSIGRWRHGCSRCAVRTRYNTTWNIYSALKKVKQK